MKLYTCQQRLMGNAFELGVYAANKSQAEQWLEIGVNEIIRLESLLSEFQDSSETSLLNRDAGSREISVSEETYGLIQRSLEISKLTNGNFDITVGPLKKLYDFRQEIFQMPSDKKILSALNSVGYEGVKLAKNRSAISFADAGQKISFAAIGKGYAAEKVKNIWLTLGVEAGYINASGDLTSFGLKPNKEKWTLGIAHPDLRDEILFTIPISQGAVATSGDYERYFIHDGKRYSHTISPFSGKPLTGTKSVSVFSPNAELSDALATACYVMGASDALDFISQLPQTECVIIDENNKVSVSSGIEYKAFSKPMETPLKSQKMQLMGFVLCVFFMCSCVSSYPASSQSYIDDPEMQLTDNASQQFQQYIMSIREGSVPTHSKKGNGGCGCN